MGKSRPNSRGRNNWYDPEDNDHESYDYRNAKQRRDEKRMKNLIRSNNVSSIVNMNDDDEDDV